MTSEAAVATRQQTPRAVVARIVMSRISKTDRQLQLQAEEDGQHLYANRVRVYPKSVHGPVRRFKWAVLIVCLGVYYLLPWLRWNRGVGRPTRRCCCRSANERFYFFNLEFWPQDIYYLTGLLIMGAVGLFLVTSLFGRVVVRLHLPADGMDRPVHVGRAR